MTTPYYIRPFLIVLALAVLNGGIAAQAKKPSRNGRKQITQAVTSSEPTPEQRRQEAFTAAWSTINEHYFDKTFSGLDWNKVRAEFQPRVKAAKTDAAFHRLLDEMLSRLGKSHLSIIVPEYFANIESAKEKARAKGEQMSAERRAAAQAGPEIDEEEDDNIFGNDESERYGIGVELRMIEGRIVITRVDPYSGAVIAGLKPGYVIESINSVSVSDMIRQARIDGNSDAEIKYLFPIQLVDSFLNGDPDTTVYLTCLDESDKPSEFTVPRLGLAGQSVSISSNLPEQFLRYEARSLNPDVGYIKFNAFAIPVIEKFCASLSEFHDKKSIIVDLRGNLGGILGSMIGLSGMLSSNDLPLGTFVSRASRSPFVAQSKNKNFKGRLVILVDNLSMSAAELFTAGLQAHGRAVVVGERTGGQSLPAIWIRLATGAVMLYPIADFITPKGVSLEGKGLLPDHVVTLDRGQLLKGVDTQLEKAIAISIVSPKGPEPVVEMRLDRLTKLGGASPPPPPPRAVGSGTGGPPPPPVTKREIVESVSDAKSQQAIREFASAIGGYDALKAILSYEAKGRATTGSRGETEGDVYIARQTPDKFLMVLKSPSLGEIREIYNGKMSLLQADYGIERNLFQGTDTTRVNIFSPVFDAVDTAFLKSLKYEGEFEVEGSKRKVLSGKTAEGIPIGLSFDSSTRMLATYSSPGVLYTLSDYRQVGGVKLPFSIVMEGMISIQLSSVSLNGTLDPNTFEKVEKCFDKVD